MIPLSPTLHPPNTHTHTLTSTVCLLKRTRAGNERRNKSCQSEERNGEVRISAGMLWTMRYFVRSYIIGLCLIWNRQLITLEDNHSATLVHRFLLEVIAALGISLNILSIYLTLCTSSSMRLNWEAEIITTFIVSSENINITAMTLMTMMTTVTIMVMMTVMMLLLLFPSLISFFCPLTGQFSKRISKIEIISIIYYSFIWNEKNEHLPQTNRYVKHNLA